MRKLLVVLAIVAVSGGWPRASLALDADDLSVLLGYTMVASTNVQGDFEGADFGKLVQLDNGMVFEFNEYDYSYSYRPSVAVFTEHVSAETLERAGITNPAAGGMALYKLVIDDDIYDVKRVR